MIIVHVAILLSAIVVELMSSPCMHLLLLVRTAMLVEWGDGSSLPLSLLQSEGCYSVGAPLTIQACQLHRAACGEIGQAQAD